MIYDNIKIQTLPTHQTGQNTDQTVHMKWNSMFIALFVPIYLSELLRKA